MREIMNNLIQFQNNSLTANIRCALIDDAVWFVAGNMAQALDYAETSKLLLNCRNPTVQGDVNKINGLHPSTKWINEADLYRCIMKSTKPEAEAFQDWVCDEVLPSIRKTGSYSVKPPITDISQLLSDPVAVHGLLLGYTGQILKLQDEVKVLEPQAKALDRIATESEGSINITNTAKTLQVPPKKLFNWLSQHDWIYKRPGGRSWIAYQLRIKRGELEHKIKIIKLDDGTDRVCEQVLVTPKGLVKLSKEILN